jgi:alkaline phosphatase D
MSLAPVLLLVIALSWPGAAQAQGPASPLTRIAFGSCADEERPQPIWDAVLAYRPELFLFAGDNVYGDVRSGQDVTNDAELIESLQQSYARAAAVPGLVALRSTVPHLATWDDHDYGRNDAGADFAGRHEAQKLFLQFWDLPLSDERHRRDGIYSARTLGPEGQRVQVILLDTRFFRSPLKPTDQRNSPGRERYLPDDDPTKTMLGEAQWAWLAERLQEPAELRLVVSSIQVLAEGHGWERWGNLPRERQRLYDLIRETRANGVLFLSGDRHIGALYREVDRVPYPLVEITSSGLNQVFPANRETGPNRLGAVYGAANFGTIDIDWWADTLTLSLRNEAGEPVRRHTVRFDELRTGR